MTEDERLSLEFVCTGKCIIAPGNKPGVMLRRVYPDGTLGRVLHYPTKNFKVHVGCVYTIDSKDEEGSTLWGSTASYVRGWEDHSERLAWEAEARAFDLTQAAKRTAKKEESRNLIQETLQPLRAAYLSTNWTQRQALEVLVLNYLRTGDVS